MDERPRTLCIAFAGARRLAAGELAHVALKAKEAVDRGARAPILLFDDATSEPIDLDFRGTPDDVLKRLPSAEGPPTPAAAAPAGAGEAPRGPGRPRLGVVAREVTLLPRHWSWLNAQPGGASVALRKLVEEARRINADKDQRRHAQERAYYFMSAIGGDLPGFEEAARALFAGDETGLRERVAAWPPDVRDHAI